MIIVEGMDNAGKSTLCQELHVLTGLEVIHSDKPKDEEALWDNMRKIMMRPDAILDRVNIISEPIYGRIIRGHSLIQNHGGELLRLFAESAPLVVYCRPHENYIFDFAGREQMEGVLTNAKMLLRCYDKYFSVLRQIVNVVNYDWTSQQSLDNVKEHVLANLENRKGMSDFFSEKFKILNIQVEEAIGEVNERE
jgi:adenylate kinase family enzyme